ncbi:MAG: gamma carbonic anhydrase family protein [Candidatus Krumholzibacteria bacterium]|nr:gamma carbonic anhydrase family protein [Candidatus Krumholzibacteria bacterium]
MLLEHRGKTPRIHPGAYVAPTATICGDVSIGEDSCVLFGAVITADGGSVDIGRRCVIMENSVIRGTPGHATHVGDHVLVGPRAYLTGCRVEDDVFLATGSTIFNGAVIGAGSEVRINGVVHIKTRIAPNSTVPIAWVAVGDPAEMHPCQEHDAIWAIQETLNFPREVFGVDRLPNGKSEMPEIARRYTRGLAKHKTDRILGGGACDK